MIQNSSINLSVTNNLDGFTISGTYPSGRSLTLISGNATLIGGATITNGQLLIGNTSQNSYDQGGLTAGTGIYINSGAGSLVINNNFRPRFNYDTTTGYVLGITDSQNFVGMGYTGILNSFVMVPNSGTPFATGTEITIVQKGTGLTFITGLVGVSIQSRGSAYRMAGQYAVASLVLESGNTWLLGGDITT